MPTVTPVPIGDDRVTTEGDIVVASPYDGAEVGRVPRCGRAEVDRAVAAANSLLNRTEQVKRYELLAEEWGPATGELTPSLNAEEDELCGIAEALGAIGKGVLQVVSDFKDVDQEFDLFRTMAERSGRPISISVAQAPQRGAGSRRPGPAARRSHRWRARGWRR